MSLTLSQLLPALFQSWKACTQLLDGLLAAEVDSKTGQSCLPLLSAFATGDVGDR